MTESKTFSGPSPFNGFVIKVSVVAALGGLLFGYDTAVIAGAIGFLEIKFTLSKEMVGWAASCAIWGCVFGAMVSGYLSDQIGRKKVLLITAVLFFISSLGAALARDLTEFVIARFVGGLGIGAASMLSPLYISEIAPAKIRGTLVSLYQLAIVIGINLIYFVNYIITLQGDTAWNVESGWRYMFGSGMLPALLFFVLLFLVPESPRWLIKRKREDEALETLEKVNGPSEGKQIAEEIRQAINQEQGTITELFGTGMRMSLVVGLVLALFSQITGVNAIIYYAPEIFKSVGFGAESAFLQTVIIGTTNTVFTFLAIWLIDRAGRKTLLIWGVGGMALCLLGIGLCFYFKADGPWLLIFIVAYIACFASSLGPIPWVIISEIYPTRTRGIAMSFCTLVLWIGVIFVTQFTPVLLSQKEHGGVFAFGIFFINAIILWSFVEMKVPETKQRTLEDIEQSWKQKRTAHSDVID